jgi:hypothetical protein
MAVERMPGGRPEEAIAAMWLSTAAATVRAGSAIGRSVAVNRDGMRVAGSAAAALRPT